MPSTPTGPAEAQYEPFWVRHVNGVEFEVKPYTAVSSGTDVDAALQSLVNHLQSWPDLAEGVTITATKMAREGHAVTADEPTP
jgi:hypothetical protein